MKKSTTILMMIGLILLLFLPSLSGNNYYFLHISIMVGIFIILSQGLNILFGYAGQISIGHAAFYAIGAYASAIAAHHFSFPFGLALLAAVLFTSLIGFLLGITCLRLRGEYLAITTVAFGEIVQVILTQWQGVSGGPEGFLTIPKAHLGPLVFDTPGKVLLPDTGDHRSDHDPDAQSGIFEVGAELPECERRYPRRQHPGH